MADMVMQFSLKELRARKNVTQEKAAEALGVSKQTYNAWEHDLSNVKVSRAVQIADYFGVTLGELLLRPRA